MKIASRLILFVCVAYGLTNCGNAEKAAPAQDSTETAPAHHTTAQSKKTERLDLPKLSLNRYYVFNHAVMLRCQGYTGKELVEANKSLMLNADAVFQVRDFVSWDGHSLYKVEFRKRDLTDAPEKINNPSGYAILASDLIEGVLEEASFDKIKEFNQQN